MQPSRSPVQRLHARAIKNGMIPPSLLPEGKDERWKKDRDFLNQLRGTLVLDRVVLRHLRGGWGGALDDSE